MIFVTVGTHEQQFNRLIEEVDRLKGEGIIEDEVIVQIGFSTYEPRHCKWSKLIPYSEMQKNIEEARIVITHGGPASFIAPLQIGKIPIVVPRQKKFAEHVNDHQLEFCKAVEERMNNIIVVEDIVLLCEKMIDYENLVSNMQSGAQLHNTKFNEDLKVIIQDLF